MMPHVAHDFRTITSDDWKRSLADARARGNSVLAQIRAAVDAKFGPAPRPLTAGQLRAAGIYVPPHVRDWQPFNPSFVTPVETTAKAECITGEACRSGGTNHFTALLEDAYLDKKATARGVSACENQDATRDAESPRANSPAVADYTNPGADAAPAEVRATKAA